MFWLEGGVGVLASLGILAVLGKLELLEKLKAPKNTLPSNAKIRPRNISEADCFFASEQEEIIV